MKLTIILMLLVSISVYAKKPTDFKVGSDDARFVDFEKAHYNIEFDAQKRTASVSSEIYFKLEKAGKAIFDLIPEAKNAKINGQAVAIKGISSPDGATEYKVIDQVLEAGEHKLTLSNSISENIKFSRGTVASGFWMSDLAKRSFLEQYMPSNIEYDQFQITFDIKLKGIQGTHKIYTNGEVTKKSENSYAITYPDYFTTSSLFFHLTPTAKIAETQFKFKSISGKEIPVTIYKKDTWLSASLAGLTEKTINILKELEGKFGAWPHPSLVIYKARLVEEMGGMEYSGATMTSVNALGHEIIHSYFARGVMPVDGNSGWIDEAIASWRDKGYKGIQNRTALKKTDMAGKSQYKRTTDSRAYTEGAQFMAYLNTRLASVGGLTAFLKNLHDHHTHTSITTQDFIKELKKFSGIDFSKEFDAHIFGKNGSKKSRHQHQHKDVKNPYHPKFSKQQLLDIL